MEIREFVYKRISELQGDLSDRKVSLGIGKNENYIQGLKLQRTLPSLDTLVSICRYFRISLSDFFNTADLNIPTDEANFFIQLREKIEPGNYEILCKAIALAEKEDINQFALFLVRHIKK